MKFLLLACVATSCLVLSWSQQPTQMPEPELDETYKKCLSKESVDFQYIADFASGKIKSDNVSKNFKCFIHCVVEARGYMKDGQILEENIVKAAENISSVEQVRKIISNCKIPKGNDGCETSYKTYICISNELK